jgi:hypothetical protein
VNLCLLLVLILGMFGLPQLVHGQANYPLDNCGRGAFSTEEDFMMTKGEPYDGNPYISDGDLLSQSGQVCARNADLLVNFNPAGVAAADLGLDAVDVLNLPGRLVAFSTELDDIFGKFTAGDLLFTSGGVIPNQALLWPFGIRYDIGLDAVHFVGADDAIFEFAKWAAEVGPEGLLQGQLQERLKRHGLDIWFSVEGTARNVENGPLLDGDLLSAATGQWVARNGQLLPNAVPAGLPSRGVDFGLDAVGTWRKPVSDEPVLGIFFSTEILFRSEKDTIPSFTDGDILRGGNGVVALNEDLIAAFAPRVDFLGLDALWLWFGPEEPPDDPNIQTLCGDRSAVDFDGGMAPINGPGTGLYRENAAMTPPGADPRRPCGEYVPVDGFLPPTNVNRFRVAYRPAGAPAPALNTADGIQTRWKLR